MTHLNHKSGPLKPLISGSDEVLSTHNLRAVRFYTDLVLKRMVPKGQNSIGAEKAQDAHSTRMS